MTYKECYHYHCVMSEAYQALMNRNPERAKERAEKAVDMVSKGSGKWADALDVVVRANMMIYKVPGKKEAK